MIEQLLATGVNIVSEENPGFRDAYFAISGEIDPSMARHGLRRMRLAASEPLVALVEAAVNTLPPDAFAVWADLCYTLGQDPAIWGAAEHMLYVGQKAPPLSPLHAETR